MADRLRIAVFSLLILAFVLVRATGLSLAAPALSLLTIASIILAIGRLSGTSRVLTALFLISGSAMLWHKGVGAAEFVLAFGSMAHLVALFAVIPLLAIPVRLGGYGQAISEVLRSRVKSATGLHMVTSALAYVCGSFMTMATVPIMMASMKPVMETYRPQDPVRFVSVSITVSHLLPMMWSPVSGALGAILFALHVDWFDVVPVMLPLSLLILVLNWGLYALLEGRRPLVQAQADGDPTHSKPATPLLLQLALVILLLVALIVGLEQWLRLGLVTIVVVSTLPFAWAWSRTLGKGQAFLRASMQDMGMRLPRMADTFAIFLSSGFFATALHLSGMDTSANEFMLQLRQMLGAHGFLMMLPGMALAASLIGLHPLVVVTLLAQALDPATLQIDAALLAVALIGSALLTYMLGPFSGTLGLVRALNGVPTVRLGWWNLPYAATYTLMLMLTVAVL